jgi:hypothetical protein
MKTATMLHNLIAKQNLIDKQNLSEKIAQDFELDLSDGTVVYRLEDQFRDTLTVSDTLTVKRKANGLLCVGEYRDFQDGRRTGDSEVMLLGQGREWVSVSYDGTTGSLIPTWRT